MVTVQLSCAILLASEKEGKKRTGKEKKKEEKKFGKGPKNLKTAL